MDELPPLPQQNKKKEANFGVALKHLTEKEKPNTCSLEAKHTHGKDYLLFSEVSNSQIAFANSISSPNGAWIRVQGINGEPDYIWLKNTPAYIVIRYPKGIAHISIGNFLFEKARSKRKSLTWERAQEIASKVVFCS